MDLASFARFRRRLRNEDVSEILHAIDPGLRVLGSFARFRLEMMVEPTWMAAHLDGGFVPSISNPAENRHYNRPRLHGRGFVPWTSHEALTVQ